MNLKFCLTKLRFTLTMLISCIAESIVKIIFFIKVPRHNKILMSSLMHLIKKYLKFWCKQKTISIKCHGNDQKNRNKYPAIHCSVWFITYYYSCDLFIFLRSRSSITISNRYKIKQRTRQTLWHRIFSIVLLICFAWSYKSHYHFKFDEFQLNKKDFWFRHFCYKSFV